MTQKPKALLGVCSNCDRERPIRVRSRSLCGTCANKLGSDPSRAPHRKYESSTCAVEDCDRPRRIREWCVAHGSRVNRYGDPRVDIPVRERTGRVLRNGRNGTKYYALWKPEHPLAHSSGYILEHRFVMWECGMLTDPEMTVHHKNGDGLDNRIENLEVLTHKEHRQRHAEEDGVLNQYGRHSVHSGTCSVDGCIKDVVQIGMCSAHVTRLRRYGDPLLVRRASASTVTPFKLMTD